MDIIALFCDIDYFLFFKGRIVQSQRPKSPLKTRTYRSWGSKVGRKNRELNSPVPYQADFIVKPLIT